MFSNSIRRQRSTLSYIYIFYRYVYHILIPPYSTLHHIKIKRDISKDTLQGSREWGGARRRICHGS